jgi:hypothetical protein
MAQMAKNPRSPQEFKVIKRKQYIFLGALFFTRNSDLILAALQLPLKREQ